MTDNRYIIALDLDGTLLDDQKKINERTVLFLRKLEQMGHVVVLASGRPVRSLRSYLQQLQLHSPLISYNGSLIIDDADSEFPAFRANFDLALVKDIINAIGLEHLDNIMCETPEDIWLLRVDEELNSFFWHEGLEITYGNVLETLNVAPMTLILKFKEKTRELDERVLKVVAAHPDHFIRFWWDSDYAELFHGDVTKAQGLEYVAKYYGIPHQNTIAFGDAENDVQMLTWANYGFAMKNANPNCRRHAKYISCLDNNHEGIIYEISKLLGIEID